MSCDHCGSSDVTAKIMVTKETGSEELNLCNNCFQKFVAENPEIKEKGVGIDMNKIANMLMSSLAKPFSEMMKKDENLSKVLNSKKTDKTVTKSLICPNCKTDEKDFKISSKVGCQKCFDIFSTQIDKKLLDLFGENSETLNCTTALSNEEKIQVLTVELDNAIIAEEYELAAKIRDDIKYLSKKIGKQ